MQFDQLFGVHEHALKLRQKRLEVLAHNMANDNTPNYQARDFDVSLALAQATGSDYPSKMNQTHHQHIGLGGQNSTGFDLKYRVPNQSSVDGNTVELQTESTLFIETVMRYRASLRAVGDTISSVRRTLREQ